MKVEALQRTSVATPLGQISFLGTPDPAGASRPVLVVIPGAFVSLGAINRLPNLLDDLCEVSIAEFPACPNMVASPTLERVALAFDMAIADTFRGRRVTVAGFDDGALVAAMIRAPEVLHVVAIEPPLISGELWPLRDILAREATEAAEDRLRYLSEVYGIGPGGGERDHRALFSSLRTPADVLAGERPLSPEGQPPGSPSHLGLEERVWLAKQNAVTVCVAPGAGHDLAREAARFVLDGLRKAVEATLRAVLPPGAVAAGLARATPLTARNVLYLGPAPAPFEAAYAARNPKAVVARARDPGARFDALVLQDPDPEALTKGNLLSLLAPGAVVLASAPLGPPARRLDEAVQASGLVSLPGDMILTPIGTALLRARHGAGGPTTPIDIVPFARTLMDIRTRLPADALRTQADLRVTYHPPPLLQRAGRPPTVRVMQRPAAWTAATWRALSAQAIRSRQVIVIEFDDHPELVSRWFGGDGLTDADCERFRVVHAIQTSTEPLIEVFRQWNPEVRVFPNAVFNLQPFPTGPRPRKVFYGGVGRGPFVAEVARALGPAISDHPDVEFVVVGDQDVFDALPTQRKAFFPYLPYERYLEQIAACGVSLSPMPPRPMVETKSDAKYLDAARAGVVTIASREVYERTIRSGENGLIADALEDWPALLSQLLSDEPMQTRIARAAWEEVRDGRMFAYQVETRRDWYAGLLARQEELDRALLERCPGVAAVLG